MAPSNVMASMRRFRPLTTPALSTSPASGPNAGPNDEETQDVVFIAHVALHGDRVPTGGLDIAHDGVGLIRPAR